MLYLIIFLLLCFLVYRYDYKRIEEGRLFWLIGITVIFIVLGGLHYRLGYDTVAYERFYDKIPPLDKFKLRDFEKFRYNHGFILLSSFTKLFTDSIVLLNFIQASFVCGVITWFFKQNTRNPFFALLLFFIFLFSLLIFEQVREAIAVGFFLLAWPSFRDRKWLKWYALSLCALAFHTSATLMFVLPVILLPGIRQLFVFGKRTFFLCAFVFAIAFIIQASFYRYIELIALTESSQQLISQYEGTHYLKGNLNIVGIVSQLIRLVLYPFLALYFLNSIHKSKSVSQDLYKIEVFVLTSIYISIFSVAVPIISRFNNYFFFFSILLMSDWIFSLLRFHGKKVRFKFGFWAFIFLPLFMIQIYSSYWSNINKSGTYKTYMIYYPYTSHLDQEKDETREKIFTYSRRQRR